MEFLVVKSTCENIKLRWFILDYTRRAGGPKGLHQLLMSAYVSLLVPWNSILRLWNLQNPVPKTSKTPTFGTLKLHSSPLKRSKSDPKTSKSSTFGSLFWTGFWTFHGRNLEFRGPKKSSKWHKSVTIALVSCAHTHTHTDRHTHIKILGHCAIGPSGKKLVPVTGTTPV